MWRKGAFLALAISIALVASGCGASVKYGEVEGVVTVDGKPLAKVEVRFMPDPGGGSDIRAVGYTDGAGRYSLKLDDGNRGIAVGNYVVCVIDITQRSQNKTEKRETPKGAKSKAAAPQKSNLRVAPEFSDATRTPLRNYTVKEGKQTIDLAVSRTSKTNP